MSENSGIQNSSSEPIEAEILEKLEKMPTREILAQVIMGPYPPPDMMEEYREKCPEVYEQIVEGVKAQRAHRMKIESDHTSSLIKISNRSELNQSIFGYIALIAAIVIILFQLYYFGEVKHYLIPAILSALAIGGKPVATIIANLADRSKKSEKPVDE